MSNRVNYDYTVISVNPPGSGSIPAAVLLRTVADDRLHAKVRDDLNLLLDRDSVEVVTGNVGQFIRQAGLAGGAALLATLEDSLSNFLTVCPRSAIESPDDPDIVLARLLNEHCSRQSRGVAV